MIKIPPQDIFLPCQVFLRAPWCWSDSPWPTHPGSNLILALSTKTLGWDSFFRKYAQKTTRCTGCPKKTHFENHQADPRLLGACKPGSLGTNFLENFGQKSDLNGLCGAFFWDTLYTSHWTCLACLHQMYILDKSWTNMRFALVPILEGERGGGERWRVRDHLAQVAQVANLALPVILSLLANLVLLVNLALPVILALFVNLALLVHLALLVNLALPVIFALLANLALFVILALLANLALFLNLGLSVNFS